MQSMNRKDFLASVRTRQAPIAGVQEGREALLTSLLMREAVYQQRAITLKEWLGQAGLSGVA